MIGVIANPADHDVVAEFFELFKTPWEFYRAGRRYDVLLCTEAEDTPVGVADLTLVYAGRTLRCDVRETVQSVAGRDTEVALPSGLTMPIHGDVATSAGEPVWRMVSPEEVTLRIGYDLLNEVRFLLTEGQPVQNAGIPTLELHIALLRRLILENGIPLVEVPPVPESYSLIACLTHDVDHPAIRNHRWDATAFGFLYRATLGSVRRLVAGNLTLRELLENWAAAFKLPFVYLGLAEDFWRGFADRYLELERGLHSTYFVIPFKGCPGTRIPGDKSDQPAPRLRAAGYSAVGISDVIDKLLAARCDVGLHGIDAWCDSAEGGKELAAIRGLTRGSKIGTRMHWLYYDQSSPVALDRAGADYDSSVGYNQTVGYRAGTTQVYKPLDVNHMLELPLHVMDTAMFYPKHMGLASRQAPQVLGRMIDTVVQYGGCLTVNWHDRSVAAERQWENSYRQLIGDMQCRAAWFATAGEAVGWFRKRRSVSFEADRNEPEYVQAIVTENDHRELPALRLRVYPKRDPKALNAQGTAGYFDVPLNERSRVFYGTEELKRIESVG